MAPASENDSLVPSGPAATPVPRRTRSGTRSREWSVEGVVGSLPWSAVMMRTSSGPSAARISGRRLVESLKGSCIPLRVVPVPEGLVEIDEVGEDETPVDRPELLDDGAMIPSSLERVVCEWRDSPAGEDVRRSCRRPGPRARPWRSSRTSGGRGQDREIVPVGGPQRRDSLGPAPANGPGDHPAHLVLPSQDLPSDPADLVEPLEGDRRRRGRRSGRRCRPTCRRSADRSGRAPAPRRWMISVPEATSFPIVSTPARRSNSSITSGGKASG